MHDELHPTIEGLKGWLARQALLAAPAPSIAAHFADALVELGLPLWRLHVGMSALHPQVESIGVTWRREGRCLEEEYGHGSFAAIATSSPFYDAVTAAQREARRAPGGRDAYIPMTRYRLEHGEGLDLSMLAEFRAAGGTDYACFVIVFGTDGRFDDPLSGAAVSFTTDRPDGFADSEVAIMADLMAPLGAALRVAAHVTTTRTLLDTYLGRDVGRRVLNGEIRRGSVETIAAAILVGDLRGFTTLADEAPSDRLVGMLDDYLDCLVGAVENFGGHVLKFLGDGLLATFAFSQSTPQKVCADALAAASDALSRIDALNGARRTARQPIAGLDLALHAGDVLYGNVGSDRRMDFTIVGPAVNEAARLEHLCSVLDIPLVASRSFVDRLGAPERFRSLGAHELRGVRLPLEVFTPT